MTDEQNKKLDELLKQAFKEKNRRDVEAFLALDTTGVVISEKTERRVQRHIRRASLLGAFKIPRKRKIKEDASPKHISPRRLAVVILIMTAILACLLSISAVRDAIKNALVNWYDNYVAVYFADRALADGDVITEYKYPRLSDEYEMREVLKEDKIYYCEYYLNDQFYFVYTQSVDDNISQHYDNIETYTKEITIADMYGVVFITADNGNAVLLSDNKYFYFITGDLSEKDLLDVVSIIQ